GGALPVVIIMGGIVATTTMYFSKETFHLLKSEKLHSVKATSIDSNFNSLRALQAMMRFPETNLTPTLPPKSYDLPMLYPEPYLVLGDDGSVNLERLKANPTGFPFELRENGATFQLP